MDKLECMRRHHRVLFRTAVRLIMVASFAVGLCHVSPLSLTSASFLFRRSTFWVISVRTQFRLDSGTVFQRTVLV